MKKQTFIVNKEDTLINTILSFKKDLSKKTIKNYITHKMVKVNNNVITNTNYQVHKNDIIEINYNKTEIKDYNLEILYEDNYLIVINKPCKLLSISNDKEKRITAYRIVSDYLKKEKKTNKIFVVHRLDEETSGILIFAKDQKTQKIMQDNWNELVKKRGYIAITDNKIKDKGTITSYLKENKQGFVYSSKKEDGKYAITHYEVIKRSNKYSILQIYIDTGRRNQIRVHLSENNHPIIGDKKYKSNDNTIKRLALHANILEFTHPIIKKDILIKTNIPKEFNNLI